MSAPNPSHTRRRRWKCYKQIPAMAVQQYHLYPRGTASYLEADKEHAHTHYVAMDFSWKVTKAIPRDWSWTLHSSSVILSISLSFMRV